MLLFCTFGAYDLQFNCVQFSHHPGWPPPGRAISERPWVQGWKGQDRQVGGMHTLHHADSQLFMACEGPWQNMPRFFFWICAWELSPDTLTFPQPSSAAVFLHFQQGPTVPVPTSKGNPGNLMGDWYFWGKGHVLKSLFFISVCISF